MTAIKKISLDFADIAVHEHYIISTIHEGVTFGKAHLDAMFEVFNTYYKDRPFISIANREFDYTIDPNMLSARNHPDLIAIAIVYYTDAAKEIVQFEKKFYNGIYEMFDSLEKAQEWSLELLEKHLKKAGL